jgi:hypothetical protein
VRRWEKAVLILFIATSFPIGAIFGGWYMYEIKKQEVMAIHGNWAVKEQVFNEPRPFNEDGHISGGRRLMMERIRRGR